MRAGNPLHPERVGTKPLGTAVRQNALYLENRSRTASEFGTGADCGLPG